MADMRSEAEARYARRFAIEHIDPPSVRTANQPCLAITGAAAQHLRAADDEPVAAGDREPAPAQLRLPGLGRVEACLLDLIQNLLDLGGRELAAAMRSLSVSGGIAGQSTPRPHALPPSTRRHDGPHRRSPHRPSPPPQTRSPPS